MDIVGILFDKRCGKLGHGLNGPGIDMLHELIGEGIDNVGPIACGGGLDYLRLILTPMDALYRHSVAVLIGGVVLIHDLLKHYAAGIIGGIGVQEDGEGHVDAALGLLRHRSLGRAAFGCGGSGSTAARVGAGGQGQYHRCRQQKGQGPFHDISSAFQPFSTKQVIP